ncbi:MAG: acyltransferase family protein, partial [Promethearchaeota archaeon]
MNEKNYLYEIELIRGFAIIIILLRHSQVFYYIDLGFFKSGYFHDVSVFGVPLFYFISGLTLTIKYKNNLNLKEFYKKRYQYLIPCYLFWSYLVLFMLNIGIPYYNDYNIIYEDGFFLNFLIHYFTLILTGQVLT